MTLEMAIKNNPYNESKGNLSAYMRYLRYNVDGFYELDSQEVRKKYEEKNMVVKSYESLDIAIKALEKQIPKKVVHTHHCPSCDKALPIKGITDDYCSECFKWNYCPDCGQALKWE